MGKGNYNRFIWKKVDGERNGQGVEKVWEGECGAEHGTRWEALGDVWGCGKCGLGASRGWWPGLMEPASATALGLCTHLGPPTPPHLPLTLLPRLSHPHTWLWSSMAVPRAQLCSARQENFLSTLGHSPNLPQSLTLLRSEMALAPRVRIPGVSPVN